MISRWKGALGLALGLLLLHGGCRGRPPGQTEETVARLVDSLVPSVEKAARLRFRTPPRSAVRSREQVRAYVLQKLDQEFSAEKARGLQATYRLLGLLPDSLELRTLLLDLFTEQIVGYYEPDSTMLFVVANADEAVLKAVVAHELVHALQHQYLRLDSILQQDDDSDRLLAAQSLLEGQATLVGLQVMVPDQNLYAMPEMWEASRERIRAQQAAMPVFSKAPRILREGIIFPYLAGADFLRWWYGSELRDTVPFGDRFPVSTEQIINPDRYGRADRPVTLRFPAEERHVLYEDTMGEFDLRVLAAELAGLSPSAEIQTPLAPGWGGDRFRLYETPAGAALVWYLVFDDGVSRTRFLGTTGQRLESRRRLGYRLEVTALLVGERPAARVVLAPDGWLGWKQVAMVQEETLSLQ
jgi:hypothetical protein